MTRRSSEARRLLKELDAELAENGARAGTTLAWSAAERQIITLILDAVDRRTDLAAELGGTADVRMRIRLSSEIRLTDGTIERLMRKITTAAPAPANESLRTIKARRAANVRWSGAS
jgi:hypothetical protein